MKQQNTLIKRIINIIGQKNLDLWFFCLFLFSSFFSIRKILYFIPVDGFFNEFTSTSVYLSDIFLFLTISCWFFILYNFYTNLSIKQPLLPECSTWNNKFRHFFTMFHVEHDINKHLQFTFISKINLLLVILLVWVLILGSQAQDLFIANFQFIKLFEFFCLFQYIIFRVTPLLRKDLIKFSQTTNLTLCSTWNNKYSTYIKFLLFLLLLNLIAMIITASKSAIIPLIFGILYLFKDKLFHVEQFKTKTISIILSIFIGLTLLGIDWNAVLIKSLLERAEIFNVSRGTLIENLFIGNGLGQSIIHLALNENVYPWKIQPIHNIPLLILSELGIIGCILISLCIYIVYKYFKNCSTWNINHKKINVPRGTLKGKPRISIDIVKIFLIAGALNSIIAILQVSIQHSVGLHWLFESYLSPDLPGVAKILFNGSKYIRGYGLFPHPNILGGFLLTQLFIIIFLINLFHTKLIGFKQSNHLVNWNFLVTKLSLKKGNAQKLLIKVLLIILLSYSFISLFDHYFWDIQQGRILFILVTGTFIGIIRK